MADIVGAISHTIATGAGYEPNITTFANSPGGNTVNVTVTSTIPLIDANGNGLIDIYTAEELNNMRHNLAGTSYKTSGATMAFANTKGCPGGACHGYELIADIDLLSVLDKNENGMIDTTIVGKVEVIDIAMGKDMSWEPIGINATRKRFTGTFEGNNHTIANLWVNVASSTGDAYAGLFGVTDGGATIRNVGIISGSMHSSSRTSSYSGGLVGYGSTVSITNSYFSGGGNISSSSASSSSSPRSYSHSGGLVGQGRTVSITNSYFSGGDISSTSSSSYSSSYSGGLVGHSTSSLTITNSYFSGGGDISSTSSSSSSLTSSYSGGLVGRGNTVSITNSYFSGAGGVSSSASTSSSSSSYSGGLVGLVDYGSVTIMSSYWNTDALKK